MRKLVLAPSLQVLLEVSSSLKENQLFLQINRLWIFMVQNISTPQPSGPLFIELKLFFLRFNFLKCFFPLKLVLR